MNMILRNKMCNKYTNFKKPQSKILKVNRIFHWSLAISIDVKQYTWNTVNFIMTSPERKGLHPRNGKQS